jgi:hypothetical protein
MLYLLVSLLVMLPAQETDDSCSDDAVFIQVEEYYSDFLGEQPVAPFMAGDNLEARLRGLANRCGNDVVAQAQATFLQDRLWPLGVEPALRASPGGVLYPLLVAR